MLGALRDLFSRKPIPAEEFEERVFSLVMKRISAKDAVREELDEVRRLPDFAGSGVEHQKLAARLYLALENYLSKEQPRKRVPQEILREQILNKCRAERAAGSFALLFLPGSERQIKLFERFTEAVFHKAADLIGEKDREELFRSLKADAEVRDITKDGELHWKILAEKLRSLSPADRVASVKAICRRALSILSQKISEKAGELRAELMFKSSYQELRDNAGFVEDVPKVLLLVPESFLEEERIGLMEKTELEEELRRKKQALESASAELQEEKTKLSSLSRKELEKRAAERTAELVKALEDLKAGRAELEEAKAKDEAFLENVGDGLAAIDLRGNIILWNKAASVISGWQKEEVVGKPLQNFIKFVRERERSLNMAFIDEAMLLGKTRKSGGDTVLITKYGKDVPVNASASPISDRRGKVASAVIIFRDITNERELQKAREEFASLATHEFRTPVAAIKGYASLLLDKNAGPLGETQKKYLEAINRSNQRLLELVNAMLNVSRIELGALAIEPEPTFLPDIADAVLAELSPKIEEKKMKVAKDYDRHLIITDLDPNLMRAIFQNLLSNAVKYSPDRSVINLAVQKQESDILIRVADAGCGIPKNQQAKVFSKLFRADNARMIEAEGTGLGLYIVKSVLDQFGGKIWFESVENKGSAFFVTIPIAGMKRREGIRGLS